MKKFTSILIAAIMVASFSCVNENRSDRSGAGLPGGSISNLPPDQGFSEYISSYTSGVIPANGVIEIRFTPEFAAKVDKGKSSNLFSFDPAIKGNTEWVDDYTIVYKPSKILPSGTMYSATLNMAKLGDIPERLTYFPFRIQTLKKDFRVKLGGLDSDLPEGKSYTLKGELVTSDFISDKDVESLLEVQLDKKGLEIIWEHPQNDNNHSFSVVKIPRSSEEQNLRIGWNGSKQDISTKGSETIVIPSLDDFSVRDSRIVGGETQRIVIELTDPLDPSQELDGLVRLAPKHDLTLDVEGNRISVFPTGKLIGNVRVIVEGSVRSVSGKTLGSNYEKSFNFSSIPPGISEAGKGVIVPASSGLIFPFRAVNLSAVDMTIIKIFNNNVPYFLQRNRLTGSSYIKSFGRPVYKGKINLINNSTINPNTWNLFTVNLADYIEVEPGVIYRIELGMRRSYSLYSCADGNPVSKYEEMLDRISESGSGWNASEDEYYEDSDSDESLFYEYAYDWQERDNPCSDAYYSPWKKLKKNLIASNIGMIAKMGNDNILNLIVSDITTAMPMSDVKLEVYDEQMQPLGTVSSGKDGFATLACVRKPSLVVGTLGTDKNWLQLGDGASLSLSSFDVAGTSPEKGMKAYIFGERDVWRPGDSIFLSVFLKEINRDIPQDHPVLFELFNPSNQRVDYQVQSVSGRNLITFKTKTTAESVTGNYNAVVRIGGASFSKRIRVETVKPNRLKIKLDFDSEVLGGDSRTNSATLNARWLSGAVSGNLKSSVELLLKPVKTTFEKYSQYIFDNPVADFYSETETIYEGSLDANGDARIKFSPSEIENAPGMLMAQITTRVFEKGGDASITQSAVKYAPYPVFVGINLPGLQGSSRMLFTDADNEIRLVTVNHLGKSVRSEVKVSIYKLSYRWWWESGGESLGYYVSGNYYKPVFTKTIHTSLAGEGSLSFNIPKKDWGRYLIVATAPTGHTTGKILLVDWPWESGPKGGGGDAATVLALNSDKEKYNTGDEIKISFPSPAGAQAIVTVESSSGILERFRVETKSPNTTIQLKALPAMAPNVYLYVSVIQPHAQTSNDIPVRLYGVMPIMVEDPATRLNPVIEMADEIRSERKFEVKVKESANKPMTYTLAVVDEGLLDITGFKTPNPWNYFYAREALSMKTWDLYDYILGAFGASLEKVFAIGGDDAFIDQASRKANRFKPVVRFIGPVSLAAGKSNTHTITLPQYTGAVRVMVVGGNSRSYGSAEKSVLVKDPLMLLATTPRVLSPGEKVTLPVTLFVLDEKISRVTLKAESNDLIKFEESKKEIDITSLGEKDVELTMVAANRQGRGEIIVTAEANGETAVYSIEIEVRSPNPPETRSQLKVLKEGESFDHIFSLFGIEGSNSAKVEITTLPPVNLEKRLAYLTGYPHGCTEQITSSAFPQIYLKDIIAADDEALRDVSKNVQGAIQQIMSRQMVGGGLALWPGAGQPDLWVTSYAGHFMIEAGRKGYNIPASFLNKWTSFQRKAAQEWKYDARYKQTAIIQAYRLYTLALSGNADRGAMNRLRETIGIPQQAGWLLAGAYAVTGRPEAATELIDVRVTQGEPEWHSYYYGGEMRDKSIILHTLVLLKNEEQAMILLKEIAEKLSSSGWYSTQSTAWALFSYMKYVETYGGNADGEAKFSISINGEKSNQKVAASKIYSVPVKPLKEGSELKVVNNSSGPLFVNVISKGVPAAGDATREDRNLTLKIDYVDMENKPINVMNLKQGTDFMMVVKVTNNSFRSVNNIALIKMVPSGWEIRNTRLFDANFGIKESSYDYRDFRDDRVYTYFTLKDGETRTFVLMLNASYRGEFYQPAVYCEAMYEENFYSRVPGGNVKVTGKPVE